MKHTYDWSKLDAGWTYCAHELPGPSLCLNGTSYWTLYFLERDTWSLGGEHERAKAQLAKCRVPAPDAATVTELRPRDEYDWSRLEGSGWKANPAFITDGDYRYWYGDVRDRLQVVGHLTRFDADNALVAQQEAERLVAKCRRDWRDEVKQACEGLMELDHCPNRTQAFIHGDSSLLTMKSDRTITALIRTDNIGHLLAISLIIERLKKLGWREA